MSDASPHIANIGRQVEVLSTLKSIFPQVLFHVIEVCSAFFSFSFLRKWKTR